MSIDLSKALDYLASKGIDTSQWKDDDGNAKSVDGTIVFNYEDGGYNLDETLLDRDGFVDSLYDENSDSALTEDQLYDLYDALAELDGEEGVSEEELEYLAGLGNETDKYDSEGNTINELDIAAFLDAVEDSADSADDETTTDDDTTTITTVLQDDDRILQDEDGNNYVLVESWSSDNDSNNCLSRIIQNSYDLEAMGIEMYSEEYYALEKAIMDANPDIYGTEDGGWRDEVGGTGRENAVLYPGDEIILPDYSTTEDVTGTEEEENDAEEAEDVTDTDGLGAEDFQNNGTSVNTDEDPVDDDSTISDEDAEIYAEQLYNAMDGIMGPNKQDLFDSILNSDLTADDWVKIISMYNDEYGSFMEDVASKSRLDDDVQTQIADYLLEAAENGNEDAQDLLYEELCNAMNTPRKASAFIEEIMTNGSDEVLADIARKDDGAIYDAIDENYTFPNKSTGTEYTKRLNEARQNVSDSDN